MEGGFYLLWSSLSVFKLNSIKDTPEGFKLVLVVGFLFIYFVFAAATKAFLHSLKDQHEPAWPEHHYLSDFYDIQRHLLEEIT